MYHMLFKGLSSNNTIDVQPLSKIGKTFEQMTQFYVLKTFEPTI